MDRQYGRFTKLSTNVIIDGEEYSHVVEFKTHPHAPSDSRLIVSGVVKSISATDFLGWREVVCERGTIYTSYTRTDPPPTTDVQIPVIAGGNIVATHEALRHYWHNNTAGLAGGVTVNRARRGDVFGCRKRKGLIIDCQAMAVSPFFVTYQSEDLPYSEGIPPVCVGTVNLATPGGYTDENRLNWYDKLRVVDGRGFFGDVEPGDPFDITRSCVFDPLDPPDFYYAVRNEAAEFALLSPSTDYFLFAEEGLLFIRKDFADGFVEGVARLCFYYNGPRFSQIPALMHHSVNDMRRIFNGLDNLWIRLEAGVGVSFAVRGTLSMGHWFSTGETEEIPESDPVQTEVILRDPVIGNSWGYWLFTGVDTGSGIDYPPYFLGGVFNETVGKFTEQTGDITSDTTSYSRELLAQEGCSVAAIEYAASPGLEFDTDEGPVTAPYFFAAYLGYAGVTFSPTASFGFSGMPFSGTGVLRRLPKGTTILEAKMAVRAQGLWVMKERVVYSSTKNRDGTSESYYRLEINDVEIRETVMEGGVVISDVSLAEDDPEAYNAAYTARDETDALRFVLMGIRWDTGDVEDPFGNSHPGVPKHKFKTMGSSLNVAVKSGKWSVVDVTDLMQTIVNDRNSVYKDLVFYPGDADVKPAESTDSMAGYLKSIMPKISVGGFSNVTTPVTYNHWEGQGTAKRVGWSSFDFRDIFARIRLPNGLVTKMVIPIRRPPMI